MIGIYKITSPNGRIYIGQTINYNNRLKKYRYCKSAKKQIRLYNSFLKYGIINHNFTFIEVCKKEDLNERERHYQDLYNVLGRNGLNCYLTASNEKPRVITEKTLEKLRKNNTGKSNPMFGIKGSKNSRSKKVICTETKRVWDSLTECCNELNLNPKYMSRWLNGSRKNNTSFKYYKNKQV